jgi:hypothetical protein
MPSRQRLARLTRTVLLYMCATPLVAQTLEPAPRYKPASRSPEALDIRSNAYGASRSAPNALAIGDRVQDFSAPAVGGGLVSLRQTRQQGDVVIIFYRGHW